MWAASVTVLLVSTVLLSASAAAAVSLSPASAQVAGFERLQAATLPLPVAPIVGTHNS